jgi:hypothetical protein
LPIEGPDTGLRGSVSHPLQSRMRLRAIKPCVGWYHPGYRPAVTSDGYFFTLLDTIEQPTQFIFGFKCSDLGQDNPPSSLS